MRFGEQSRRKHEPVVIQDHPIDHTLRTNGKLDPEKVRKVVEACKQRGLISSPKETIRSFLDLKEEA